jgi:hypothetical protein
MMQRSAARHPQTLGKPARPAAVRNEDLTLNTPDEMLSRGLLTADQHHQISAWIHHAKTPEAIMQMPAPLWQALELASVLMNVDSDLTQPPSFDLGA